MAEQLRYTSKPLYLLTRADQPFTGTENPLRIERLPRANEVEEHEATNGAADAPAAPAPAVSAGDVAVLEKAQLAELRRQHEALSQPLVGSPPAAPKPPSHGPSWYAFCPDDEVLDHASYLAPFKAIGKCRESRALEREERKRRVDHEEWRRRKQGRFGRELVARRDDVMKAGRARRAEAARRARGCKAKLELDTHRIEVEESRTARRRLQALRANDMAAYTQLVEETKNKRLKYLLEQTDSYIRNITDQVGLLRDAEVDAEARKAAKEAKESGEDVRAATRPAEKPRDESYELDADEQRRNATAEYYKTTHATSEEVRQPKMLVGGQLKEYQLAGLTWMVSLYNNRLNGILADEMGLGKTIQSIALLAHLLEKGNPGPFLVVAPLSTLSNWSHEFAKWAPGMTVLTYKGPPAARKEAQRELAALGEATTKGGRRRRPAPGEGRQGSRQLNVLLTTYEYVMRDRAVLRRVEWEYIVVDEGHRMKNANSKFAQTLGNLYSAKRRLLLTGTPLQNSLPELWALLNFLLPSIFSSVDTFEGWFNKPFSQFSGAPQANVDREESCALAHEERMLVIHRLHEVLRPFVLRRVKSAVLGQLPEKVEKVLRCDLTAWQKVVYEQIRSSGAAAVEANGSADRAADDAASPAAADKPGRGRPKKKRDDAASPGGRGSPPPVARGLNNVLMQLRKCCNHPFLFRTDAWRVDESLVRSSGKFLLLDSMLPKLKAAGHRVLLFSQMTALMDLLEDFFALRDYDYLRLDGSTAADERERRMARFNDPSSPAFVFLLSTRAGGLGLNLASADTVVIFDSDWNPMMDAQAQDRAHRIGQKNDVRVFRLISTSPVEERILQRATDKLNMNNLIVEAGKFSRDSKADERKAMVEELLREYDPAGDRGGDGDGDDDGAKEHDSLAETMAIDDGEYELYAAVDARRAAAGAALPAMRDDEVPGWVRAGANSAAEGAALDEARDARAAKAAEEEEAGGRRAKKKQDYTQISDRAFMKLIGGPEEKPPLYKAIGPNKGELKVKLKCKRKRG